MIDWSAGYSSTWRVYEVDPLTWSDAGELVGVRSVSVERDATDDAPLLESGTVELDVDVGEPLRERYLRVVMVAHQFGEAERVEVATLLCSASEGQYDHGGESRTLVGRSVLWPAQARRLLSGTYVPRGADGAEWVAAQLRSCVKAPVVTEGTFALAESVVLDLGVTVLEAVWSVMNAGGFCIQVSGDGTIHVVQRPTEPSLLLDDAGAQLVVPGIRRAFDMAEVPSRYVAVEGDLTAIAVNDDPSSPTSAAARGYTVDVVDDAPERREGETLTAYARRRLAEESVVRDVRTYSREWWPGVLPLSVVRGTLASVGLDGDMRVIRQSLACGRGIVVSEEAESEVRTWQA